MRSWMLACVFICTAGFGGAVWAKLDVVFLIQGLSMTVFGGRRPIDAGGGDNTQY